MPLSTIIVGSQTVTLVDMPAAPAPRTIQFNIDDPAASLTSGFSNQTQVQRWPGADILSGTMSLPPLTQAQADQWISFLMLLRGQANAFMLGDSLKLSPRGRTQRSVPICTGATNLAGTDQLVTSGWSGAGRVLEAGDWIQVGYRLYRNLLPVVTSSGFATLSIWPTLRESVPDGTPIILKAPRGLFRLSANKRTWNADFTRLTTLSIPFIEWRGCPSS